MALFDVMNYGAKADGQTNDAAAIQKAIDACTEAGGGRVVIPAGRKFLTGTILLRDHVDLHLEPGSLLLSSIQKHELKWRLMIAAADANNIAISGTGTIDGRGREFMTRDDRYILRMDAWRPRMMGLFGCRNVRIENITMKDSANWGLHLTDSDDVVIRGISILNDIRLPNCDGIDPDRCRNVRISDCHIEAGDDCIVLKSMRSYDEGGPEFGKYFNRACENIVVNNCTMISTSCALKIGTETVGDIRNVLFNNCVIKSSSRGLGVFLRDTATIENIAFSNCYVQTRLFYEDWWGRAEPIYVTAFHRHKDSPIGKMRNISFTNIVCEGENGAFIAAEYPGLISGVTLDNVDIRMAKTSKWPAGTMDRRPCVVPGLVPMRSPGYYVENVADVTLRDCRIRWEGTPVPEFGSAIYARQAPGLHVQNFRGTAAHADLPDQDV
ncbi:MAG: glycoside hydrolase family 28 protein [Phycisphaerae bacterium]